MVIKIGVKPHKKMFMLVVAVVVVKQLNSSIKLISYPHCCHPYLHFNNVAFI